MSLWGGDEAKCELSSFLIFQCLESIPPDFREGELPDDYSWTPGVRLYLATENHELDCQVAWRNGGQVGLRFQGQPQPPSRTYG